MAGGNLFVGSFHFPRRMDSISLKKNNETGLNTGCACMARKAVGLPKATRPWDHANFFIA